GSAGRRRQEDRRAEGSDLLRRRRPVRAQALRPMITGALVLLYISDPDADRAFFRDVLEFSSVDAGGGWLIFALPPSEVAVHAVDATAPPPERTAMLGASLYLMCDDIAETMGSLQAKGVECSAPITERRGIVTTVRLPS